MQERLQIACIQPDILWEDIEGNIQLYTKSIESISDTTDLIILPEMFATGFSMKPERCAETMEGLSVSWMKEMASVKNAAIMGSLAIQEGNQYFNRLIFVQPDGALRFYDKKHLFTLAGEDQVYTAGRNKLIIKYLGWRICPMICYDLRFPVWSRNDEDYDVLVYMANWPKPRIKAWDILLEARAIENMCYVIGVNRVGEDGNKYKYIGHTQVIDGLGNKIANTTENKVCIVETSLNKLALVELRNKFQFLNDKDSFSIKK